MAKQQFCCRKRLPPGKAEAGGHMAFSPAVPVGRAGSGWKVCCLHFLRPSASRHHEASSPSASPSEPTPSTCPFADPPSPLPGQPPQPLPRRSVFEPALPSPPPPPAESGEQRFLLAASRAGSALVSYVSPFVRPTAVQAAPEEPRVKIAVTHRWDGGGW